MKKENECFFRQVEIDMPYKRKYVPPQFEYLVGRHLG